MATLAVALGLRSAGPGLSAPNWAPGLLIWQFFFAYGVLSSRGLKGRYGLDHQESPREDLAKYGEAAVRSGKITQAQLDMLRRNEAAHANSVEHFTMFAASMAFATFAGVEPHLINRAGFLYAGVRAVYGAVYILTNSKLGGLTRGVAWWAGNFTCFWLLYRASGKINSSVLVY